jgi:hypothetical protein
VPQTWLCACQLTWLLESSTEAIPSHWLPSEYVAVQWTVHTPGAACLTVDWSQDIFVITDPSEAVLPTSCLASSTMHECASQGGADGLPAAADGEPAAEDGAACAWAVAGGALEEGGREDAEV